jgi:signal transduction histidine kinase
MSSAPGGRFALRSATLSISAGLLLGASWLAVALGFLSEIRSADATRSLADRIHIDLLECRRREKDFLLRSLNDPDFHAQGSTPYLQLHQEALSRLGRSSEELRTQLAGEESATVTGLLDRKQQYERAFEALVAAYRRIGFKTWGIEGRLHDGFRSLESKIEASGRPALQRDLLLLRLAESEFLLLGEELGLSTIQKRIDRLRESIRQLPAETGAPLQELLDRHLQNLAEYRAAILEIGLNENLGLQGKFRTAAHDIDPIVSTLVDRAGRRYRSALGSLVAGLGVASLLLTALLSATFFLTRAAQVRSRNLSETAAALSRSNDELQQFAYVASHDLQEPLRAVAGCVGLLQKRCEGTLDARSQELIAHTIDGAVRMQTLVDDLLTLSRVDGAPRPAADVDSGKVLQAALENLGAAIRESGASITHDPLPAVAIDPTQLLQVFQNLLGNAIKFRGPQPPAIHVGARREDKQWRFSVRDNGIGIEPQYFERIFRVFQRLHSRRDYPGSGIGLAICRKILLRLGGRIWLESELNKGTTFFFTVPDRTDVP